MSDRDIIILLAERVMGWKVTTWGPDTLHFQRPDTPWTFMWNAGVCATEPRRSDIWNPLESIADAFEMEETLPEEKRDDYSRALWQILTDAKASQWNSKFAGYWYFAHAAPRQRCLAAVGTLEAGL